ncbi:ribosome small subunit-dependent GTPase A [Herbiconiux sp. L3-i23]|uniref:ribosome small subunit-dependent GTPase A n=1 Tax=Herbiconiux sp. L3-i23 TaxID=2905871 RepID=UPI00206D3D7E|nr:ribosome small subunit-dependent GTPase A [Herbiconiux sp. L3-i23]BDI23320.1 putative ribosome biogenesis GTPase RsgA [Herbiconiux sp. L3-i23]
MSWLTDDEDEPYSDYDESAARVRPNPRGTRPRSKQRPEHDDAVRGRVLTVDRGRLTVLLEENTEAERELQAKRARELGRTPIVTGDLVDVVGDLSGDEGTLARVVRIAPRSTLLRRSADDSDEVERVVVANADQLMIVVAAANPEPRAGLVDRYLIAAFDAGIEPILVVTKTDLADPASFLAEFDILDLDIVLTARGGVPLEEFRRRLIGHTTVAVGHSGVGKSTLVNALVPGAARATGVVNEVTGRGRHTSSSTISLRVRDNAGGSGWIIDTPGVRSFGLGHVDPASVMRSFALHAIAPEPPDGEVPLVEAHDWEIVDRVREGELGPVGQRRLDSLQRILTTLDPKAERDWEPAPDPED